MYLSPTPVYTHSNTQKWGENWIVRNWIFGCRCGVASFASHATHMEATLLSQLCKHRERRGKNIGCWKRVASFILLLKGWLYQERGKKSKISRYTIFHGFLMYRWCRKNWAKKAQNLTHPEDWLTNYCRRQQLWSNKTLAFPVRDKGLFFVPQRTEKFWISFLSSPPT